MYIFILFSLSWDWSLTVSVLLREKEIQKPEAHVWMWAHVPAKANPKRKKDGKFCQLSSWSREKSSDLGKGVSLFEIFFLGAPTEGCCCTWCEVTAALADRSFPGYAVPRVTVLHFFRLKTRREAAAMESMRHKR